MMPPGENNPRATFLNPRVTLSRGTQNDLHSILDAHSKMNRLLPYRGKVSEEVAARIAQTLSSTMYLVQTIGPTSYVIQEQNCDRKYKVLIGSMQSCSCGTADICIHILFVMLKVFRVPPTAPVVWQKSLIDSEIETLLGGGFRQKSRPALLPCRTKRKEKAAACTSKDADIDRLKLVEGEVCAICQEDMNDNQPLTYCRKGCGNNFHMECMKVFGESRRQSNDHIVCPLCRQDWGNEALTVLQKEIKAANRAPNVHKGTSCRKCKTKPLRCERYRCVQCKNVDLCARCFKSNVHINHAFVMKQNVFDPWIPALRETQPRTAISTDVIRDLETRELSTNDYDVLLQLDDAGKLSIQDYLMKVVSGTKTSAERAKSFGESEATCSLCAQSLRLKAALHSTSCGHVFHESCLARSILSQDYKCPFPRCGLALLPGLLYLQQKDDTSKKMQLAESKLESPKIPNLDASFIVMGLSQQHTDAQTSRITIDGMISHRATRQFGVCKSNRLPSLPGSIHFGSGDIPLVRPSADLPALFSSPSNQQNVIKMSSAKCSTRQSKKEFTKRTQLENGPPLFDQIQGHSWFQNDSKKIKAHIIYEENNCAELKAVTRFQKQRLLLKRQGQSQNDKNCEFSIRNGLTRADETEVHRLPIIRNHPEQCSNNVKQKLMIRRQVPGTPIHLFVGDKSSK